MSQLKIYGVPQSRTFRVLWMAKELGLDHENVPIHFRDGGTRTPDYLAVNPNGRIPAIEDGDLTLWESMAINLYLAKKHGGGLWPTTVEDEGRTFQWSLWVMTEVERPLLTVLFNRAFLPEEKRDAGAADKAEQDLQAPLGVLERALDGRDYLLGKGFTVADLNVASVLSWARLSNVDLGSFPAVDAWLRRCLARPAVKASR